MWHDHLEQMKSGKISLKRAVNAKSKHASDWSLVQPVQVLSVQSVQSWVAMYLLSQICILSKLNCSSINTVKWYNEKTGINIVPWVFGGAQGVQLYPLENLWNYEKIKMRPTPKKLTKTSKEIVSHLLSTFLLP